LLAAEHQRITVALTTGHYEGVFLGINPSPRHQAISIDCPESVSYLPTRIAAYFRMPLPSRTTSATSLMSEPACSSVSFHFPSLSFQTACRGFVLNVILSLRPYLSVVLTM
jgi:hypothetical protein